MKILLGRSHAWVAFLLLGLPHTAASAGSASYLRSEDHLIAGIVYRLATAGTPYCAERFPLTGLLFHHLAEYDSRERQLIASRYRLDLGPGVLTVLEGSPAAEAGLMAGDVLLAVNGRPFPSGASIAAEANRRLWRRSIEGSEGVLQGELKRGRATLRVLRAGRELQVSITARSGCPGSVRLARSPQVNGFVSGRYVVMTTGLMGFTTNHDELAIIAAHEIAHLILRHTERLQAQGVPRGDGRWSGRSASLVRATEEEADRLGLKLVWAAGYDVAAAIPFWRRFYAKYDRGLQLFRTHPSIRAREKLISETIAELGASHARTQRPELGESTLRQR